MLFWRYNRRKFISYLKECQRYTIIKNSLVVVCVVVELAKITNNILLRKYNIWNLLVLVVSVAVVAVVTVVVGYALDKTTAVAMVTVPIIRATTKAITKHKQEQQQLSLRLN